MTQDHPNRVSFARRRVRERIGPIDHVEHKLVGGDRDELPMPKQMLGNVKHRESFLDSGGQMRRLEVCGVGPPVVPRRVRARPLGRRAYRTYGCC